MLVQRVSLQRLKMTRWRLTSVMRGEAPTDTGQSKEESLHDEYNGSPLVVTDLLVIVHDLIGPWMWGKA